MGSPCRRTVLAHLQQGPFQKRMRRPKKRLGAAWRGRGARRDAVPRPACLFPPRTASDSRLRPPRTQARPLRRSSESPAPEPSGPRLRFPAGERRSPRSFLRGRRLLPVSSPASSAGCRCPPRPGASAVTKVTTTRPVLPAGPSAPGPSGGSAQARTRRRGARARSRPALRALAPAPPTAAADQSGCAPRGRPRWRYAAFDQSRVARPARRRRVRR